MNKTFKQYYKQAKTSSKKALKGAGIFKYYSYLLLEILTIICPLAAPIVALFGVRLAKNVNENGKIEYTKSFQASDHPISYWTYLSSSMVGFLIFLSVILIIAFITLILLSIGYLFTSMLGLDSMLAFLFGLPGAILLVVFIFALPYLFVPIRYILSENPKLGLGKVLHNSLDTLKHGGKKVIFLDLLVLFLKMLGFNLITFVVNILLRDLSYEVASIVSTICYLLMLYLLPRFILISQCVRQQLFSDILFDTYFSTPSISGVIERQSKKKNDSNSMEDLFDDVMNNDDLVEFDVDEKQYAYIESSDQKTSKNKKTKEIKNNVVVEKISSESTPILSDELKHETEPVVDEVEVPHEEVETAVEEVETPQEEVETVVEQVEAPHEEVETAVEQVEVPHEEVEAAVEQVEDPHEGFETVVEQVEAPHEEVETVVEQVEAPHEEVETVVEQVEAAVELNDKEINDEEKQKNLEKENLGE